MHHRLAIALALTATLTHCSAAGPIIRTIEDAAYAACQQQLRDDAKAQGLDADQLCRDYEVLRPFIDAILAAKGKAAMKAHLAPADAGAD